MASPAYELATDAQGNVVLVPATTQPQKPKGFLEDVASKAREYFAPKASDFTEGTTAAYEAGKDISQRGYGNLRTNPLYGAGQVVAGSALSAISPLAGATEFAVRPVGRTFGPSAERAADIATMVAPTPSKGTSMLKLRPKAAAASELANIPREFSYLPRDMQETINAMPPADREMVFRTLREEAQATAPTVAARPAATPAAEEAVQTARSISPVDLAIQQNRNPGRFVNPETGMPQSVRDPLTGQMRPAMGAIHDPFEALAQRVSELPGPVEYLTKPRPVINPETGNQLQAIGPKGQFGPYRFEFTPGQRAAQAGVAGAVLTPIGMMANNEANRREEQNIRSQFDQSAPNQFTLEEALKIASARPEFNQTAPNTFSQQDAIKLASLRPEFNQSAPNTFNADQAAKIARARMTAAQATGETAPAPMRRPDDGILSKIFSGQDYQSKGGQLRQDGRINWGDPESAADFFRASKALQETPDATGMKRGGSANAKPDSVHKALEIIHHLISTR